MSIEAVKKLAEHVDGFLTDREGIALYRLAASCRTGAIVEIGSWKGKSTIWLAQGTATSARCPVYAIDHHVGSEEHSQDGKKVWTFHEFENNIRSAGIETQVQPLVMTSQDARKKFHDPVGLLFIDGAHDYQSVKDDYESWAPLVPDHGIIAWHDAPWPGVNQLIGEIIQRNEVSHLFFTDSLIFARKSVRSPFWQRWRNRGMFRLANWFYAINRGHGPKQWRVLQKNLVKFGRWLLSRI